MFQTTNQMGFVNQLITRGAHIVTILPPQSRCKMFKE